MNYIFCVILPDTSKHNFFKDVKKFKGQSTSYSKTINGKCTPENIAEEFAREYQTLYNSCKYDNDVLNSFKTDLDVCLRQSMSNVQDVTISIVDIKSAIKLIKKNKSDGVYDFMSDNFIYGTDSLFMHLSRLLSMCLLHGYFPSVLLLSTLIPIPKDKLGDLTASTNYRGIALCVLCLKIFEYVLLNRHSMSLKSSCNQFAYKNGASTTQCTWLAREVIEYYKQNGSDIYGCLLDCSKAFDKIPFDKLFYTLLKKGLSPIIIRLMFYNYFNSTVRIKWSNTLSDSFNVSNGVRQGAVLSPFLFNIYMDDLIADIVQKGDGCWMGTQFYGILVYADDILLLSPTVSGLQKMLNTCSDFGTSKGLEFNCKKTMCIHFHHDFKCHNSLQNPKVYLKNKTS